MKKILVIILAILAYGLILLSNNTMVYAACSNDVTSKDYCNEADKESNKARAAGYTEIFTSEKVPGADCKCEGATKVDGETCATEEVSKRKYKCTVTTGIVGFQGIIRDIVRVVINIVLLLGVLAVVGLGIAWSFAGGDDIKAKTTLKTWAINIVIGLLILFMFGYILRFLAPWVYQ